MKKSPAQNVELGSHLQNYLEQFSKGFFCLAKGGVRSKPPAVYKNEAEKGLENSPNNFASGSWDQAMDTVTFRTTIHPSLKKTILIRGTCLAAIGLLPMLYGSLFFDQRLLSRWGILIFFFGVGLITLGMLPYRRLTRLEQHPDELILMGDHTLHYDRKGKHSLIIPFSSIETIAYVENARSYGARVELKKKRHPCRQRTSVRAALLALFQQTNSCKSHRYH